MLEGPRLFENGNMTTPRPAAAALAPVPLVAPSLDLPPPPPPPPPPQSAPPLVNAHPRLDKFRELYESPDVIVQRHEDLQDAREDLMGTRFRMQAKRKRVRTVREHTGEKEGVAISQMRQFLLEHEIDLPPNVQEAWDQVHASRDQLGMLEAEYDEVEEKYHSQEIRYTEVEATFVDNLLNSGPPPSVMLRPDVSVTRVDPWTSFAIGSPEGWNAHSLADEAERADSTADHEQPQDQIQQPPAQSVPIAERPFSSGTDQNLPRLTDQLIDQIYSSTPFRSAETRARVDDWLFDILSNSCLQRAQLRALDPFNSLEQESWWQLVEQTWTLDSYAATQPHTGDSTFSQGIGSQPPSAADLVVLGPDSLDLKDPVPRTLLPEEQTLDALEEPSVAPSIESGDLWEESVDEVPPTIIEEHKLDDTTHSVSTDPANTHRTFSSDDLASNTTIERACSCLNCRTIHGHPPEFEPQIRHTTFIDRQVALRQGRSPMATPKQNAQDSGTPNDSLLPIALLESPKPTSAVSESLIPGWPSELVDDYKRDERDPVSTHDSLTPRLGPYETSISPCPSFDTSRSSATEQVSSIDPVSAPTARTNQLKPSSQLSFSILPLTPHALHAEPSGSTKLDLPFVTISDTSLRLPGPTSDDMYS